MTRTAEIEHLLRAGQRIRAKVLDVRRVESPLGHVRVAVVVPKHGNTAVRRNRLKRQLRELTRAHVLPRETSCDVLVRARREAYGATFAILRDDLSQAALQLDAKARAP